MTPQLVRADYVDEYRLCLTFADGVSGEIDLQSELWGPVFEPLRDVEAFKQFQLNRELNTVCWPTGADLAPEFLYKAVQQERQPV